MTQKKIALITGTSRGLGRATALALAARGVDIIGTYHSNAAEDAAMRTEIEDLGARVATLRLDAGDTSGFAGFAEAVQGILRDRFDRTSFDYLVNNAGTGLHRPFAETSEVEFDALLNLHFKGVYFLTQRLLPLIADGGRIVNISSGLARFSVPGASAYAAMKGAVEVLTRYLAAELGPRGIAVNTVAPGAIATDFGGGRVRDDAGMNAFVANATALGRAGLPEDIGPAIAALLSHENRWVNAQRIEISGGMFL